jgi:hypothetical protein
MATGERKVEQTLPSGITSVLFVWTRMAIENIEIVVYD